VNSDRLLPGSLFGGMLLFSGSCIGAGMLALPILTGLVGFFPSLIMMFLACALMTFTGLLLVESNGWFFGQVNLLSMVERSLGRTARSVAWIVYLLFFYSVLLAYIAVSSKIVSPLLGHIVPDWVLSFLFTGLFGWVI